MRISDWSSDVCSSDLRSIRHGAPDTSQSSQHWAQPIDRSVSGNRSPRPQPTNVLEIAFAGTIVAHASRSTITWRRSGTPATAGAGAANQADARDVAGTHDAAGTGDTPRSRPARADRKSTR